MTPKHTVLIIEDDRLLRGALVDKFIHEWFEVKEAENGKQWLDLALSIKPDVILLDVVMPVMDGVGFMDALRLDPWWAKAWVIILSNLGQDSVSKALLWFFDYLVKADYSLDEIHEKVCNFLASKK